MNTLAVLLMVLILGVGEHMNVAETDHCPTNEAKAGASHGSCNICSRMEESLTYLKEIHQKVSSHDPTRGAGTSGLLVRVGIPSSTADDSASVATCPAGSTVVGCRCSHEDITCDGVMVTGQDCTARKSLKNQVPIQAIALCAMGDKGSYALQKAPADEAFSSYPEAVCPAGTQVAACFLQNFWMDRSYVQTILDVDSNSCKVNQHCIHGEGCCIQALCKRI